jgi:hypothetical protein
MAREPRKKKAIKGTFTLCLQENIVGFPDIIHAMKTIKQNYSRVPRILLDKSSVV